LKETIPPLCFSQGALKSIQVKQTPKVIKAVRDVMPGMFMVTFKYEDNITMEKLESIAKKRIKEGYQMVVANRREDISSEKHHSIIVDETGIIARPTTKTENAQMILGALEKKVKH